MLTLIISIMFGLIAGWASSLEYDMTWTIIIAASVFAVFWIGIGLFIRRQINKVNATIQDQMGEAQKRINRKLQMFQNKPGANVKSVQKTLEKDQNEAIAAALKTTHQIDRYFKWNFLLKKQISTMRMMFYYQMKNFKKVDELLPGCMFLDPRATAFKIARMYKRKNGDIDSFFAKKCRRLKGENAALLYGLYSWILVKNDEADKALKLLTAARKKINHPTIVENREKLANGKIKQFSNSGLGELWYSLYLEEPKVKQKKMHRKF
ncbi:MAG: DUF3021 domain-containing protein [Victivallales bacterium]|nr:DUF3021 domain-containing protein [Victivallales bacterium]